MQAGRQRGLEAGLVQSLAERAPLLRSLMSLLRDRSPLRLTSSFDVCLVGGRAEVPLSRNAASLCFPPTRKNLCCASDYSEPREERGNVGGSPSCSAASRTAPPAVRADAAEDEYYATHTIPRTPPVSSDAHSRNIYAFTLRQSRRYPSRPAGRSRARVPKASTFIPLETPLTNPFC